jgi:hypothetical protein
MPETRTIRATLSLGHAEYVPWAMAERTVAEWNPYDDDLQERISLVMHTPREPELLQEWFTKRMGTEPSDDWDLSWQHIWTIEADEGEWMDWFDDLLAQVGARPSGDDDTFDYWPSGCRLLVAMARVVDDEAGHGPDSRVSLARGAIKAVLNDMPEHIAADIEDRVGLEE